MYVFQSCGGVCSQRGCSSRSSGAAATCSVVSLQIHTPLCCFCVLCDFFCEFILSPLFNPPWEWASTGPWVGCCPGLDSAVVWVPGLCMDLLLWPDVVLLISTWWTWNKDLFLHLHSTWTLLFLYSGKLSNSYLRNFPPQCFLTG